MNNRSEISITDTNLVEVFSNIEKAIEMLEWNWAVNFRYILELIEKDFDKLDASLLQRIRNWIVFKIQYCMKWWTWSDLKWADKLLKIFNIEEIKLSEEIINFIEYIYPKLNYQALNSISPWLWFENGKFYMHNILPWRYYEKYWREYIEIPYIREILLGYSFIEEELTDEFISKILEIRELLIKMYLDNSESKIIIQNLKKWISWILDFSDEMN